MHKDKARQSDPTVMLVTGGTGSIGSEVARAALAENWHVVLHGSTDESVAALVGALTADYPDRVTGVVADVRVDGAIARLIEDALACYGHIDAVVDCLVTGPSGGGITGLFEQTDPDQYLPFAEMSIVYLERLARAVLPALKDSRGCMVAFVSDAALFPAPRQALIGAMRAAAVGFVKNLAVEVARDGVRVHCISPSFVENTRTAEKLGGSDRLEKARSRAGLGLPTPTDIASAVLFLCGDGARKMTGQILSINGGLNV